MNLSIIDWLIVFAILSVMIGGVIYSKKLMRSVADFLAAGRTAGRYVVSMSQGMAMLGAITIVGMFEMNFISGFNLRWWELANVIILTAITVSGWVIYRFRQTRALTMAQFFEMRYSKNFRVFAGILAFISGIINFGIFPAVGARFFIHFCGFPKYFGFLGLEISTFAVLMLFLLGVSMLFIFAGGQIAVIITDFIQGLFVNTVFVIIVIYLLSVFDWETIFTTVSKAPENASLINPFNSSNVEDYNIWYFFIGTWGLIYGKLSWQGVQGYNSSAKSAHEAKMGEVLGNWRNIPQWSLFLVIVPVIAYTVMHNPQYSDIVANIQPVLDSEINPVIQKQIIVPLVLTQLLPVGLIGAFAAIMLAAFISTHDTYLHSWGSIFIQDVIMPFRKKPFEQKYHIKILKYSIFGVAVFIFIFSILFEQAEYIFLFFAVSSAIFTGGSGAVIIGGLYWKRGTTTAAWSALIAGGIVATGGLILSQTWVDCPINGQEFWGISMLVSPLVYVLVSLVGKKQEANMDKLLHRGEYAVKGEEQVEKSNIKKRLKVLGISKECTKSDKLIYYITWGWTIGWTIIFIVGTIYSLSAEVTDKAWMDYWTYYIFINLVVSIVVLVWFSIGGIKDLKEMISRLKKMDRDTSDDGFVMKEDHK